MFSGGSTQTADFTAYINPYLVVSKGGNYTKHIYIGSQRIVSKLGDLDSYGQDPRRIEYAGSNVDGANVDYAGKYDSLQQTIKDRYAYFEVPYHGTDNDDYVNVNGQGFCRDDTPRLKSFNPSQNDNPELFQYYYHSDHLGSSSLITNLDGEIVQHVEYVPFGEVFIEERNNTWNTPYLFNAKELDEETGLVYYGARYYDPRISIWLSTDPLQEKYPNISTYVYCVQNPVKYIDPDGREKLNGLYPPVEIPFKADFSASNAVQKRAYSDNNIIHIYAHGSVHGFTYTNEKGVSTRVTDAKGLVSFLNENSKLWKESGGKDVIIALHSCNTGATLDENFTNEISRDMPDVTFVMPATELYIDERTGKEQVAYQYWDFEEKTMKADYSQWNIVKNGDSIGKINGDIDIDNEFNAKKYIPGYKDAISFDYTINNNNKVDVSKDNNTN